MADGSLTLTLDDETARRLQAAAEAAGLPVADYAVDLISEGLGGSDWSEALGRLEAYHRTGDSVPLDTALETFDRALQDRLAGRK